MQHKQGQNHLKTAFQLLLLSHMLQFCAAGKSQNSRYAENLKLYIVMPLCLLPWGFGKPDVFSGFLCCILSHSSFSLSLWDVQRFGSTCCVDLRWYLHIITLVYTNSWTPWLLQSVKSSWPWFSQFSSQRLEVNLDISTLCENSACVLIYVVWQTYHCVHFFLIDISHPYTPHKDATSYNA